MNNEKRAQEIADNHKDYYVVKGNEFPSDSYDECESSAMAMAEWKDKQTAEALHKACLAIMEDLGSKLGRIQLKAAAVKDCVRGIYVSDKMDEIIDAASDINKFAGTLEDYLRQQLGLE